MIRREIDNEHCPRCKTTFCLIQRDSDIDMDKPHSTQEMVETYHCTECSQKYEFKYALRSVIKCD